MIAIPATWVVWAMVARGGLSLPLAGIALVHASGLPASRRACGLRALLVWAPPTALLAASRYVQEFHPEATGLSLSLWIGAIILLLGYIAVGASLPQPVPARSPGGDGPGPLETDGLIQRNQAPERAAPADDGRISRGKRKVGEQEITSG